MDIPGSMMPAAGEENGLTTIGVAESAIPSADDEHGWEYSKENIRPTRHGHKLKLVVEDIKAANSITTGTEEDPHLTRLKMQEATWREQIAGDESGDPLKIWTRFLKWHAQVYSRRGDVESQNTIFEDCIEALINTPSYQNDARFFNRVFTPYIALNSDNALSVYGFLESRRFFQQVAAFYTSWALSAEMNGRYQEAERIYQLGTDRKATPITLLMEKWDHFRMRNVAELTSVDDVESVTSRAPVGADFTLAPIDDSETRAFDQQRQGHRQALSHVPNQVTHLEPQVPLEVFDENGVTTDVNVSADTEESHVIAWKSFGRIFEQKKENTVKPEKFTDMKPLPLTSRQKMIEEVGLGANMFENPEDGDGDMGFTVYDENPEEPVFVPQTSGTSETEHQKVHAVVQPPVKQAEPVVQAAVDSNDFFASIFQDDENQAKAQKSNHRSKSKGLSVRKAASPSKDEQKQAAKLQLRNALRVFYKTYNPEKLAHVDLFMKKFRGKETSIAKALRKKYPDADLTEIDAAAKRLRKR